MAVSRRGLAGDTLSERHPGEGFRGLHAVHGPDLLDDDVPDRVERIRLDLRDEVVFPEQRVELDDLRKLDELLVDLLLPVGFDVNEDESDGRGASLGRGTSGL